MAKSDTATTGYEVDPSEWEDINVGLGTEHDVEEKGPLVGIYVETQNVTIQDKQTQEARPTNAHIFDVNGQRMFIWGSYNLDLAMNEISQLDRVRVEFIGRNNFTGDKGPQQIKQYRVQRARRPE